MTLGVRFYCAPGEAMIAPSSSGPWRRALVLSVLHTHSNECGGGE